MNVDTGKLTKKKVRKWRERAHLVMHKSKGAFKRWETIQE